MKKAKLLETVYTHMCFKGYLKYNKINQEKGITLVALIITIIFSYDEKVKCSNNNG